jgi:hypothetical protein
MRPIAAIALTVMLLGCPGPAETCPDGGCPADGGDPCLGPSAESVPNLLDNPGFECGSPPSGWYTTGGVLASEVENPKSGSRAARFLVPDGGVARLWHERDAIVDAGTKTYCANAWVRAGTAKDARLTLRRVGTNIDENFSTPLTNEWVLLPPPTHGPLKFTAQDEPRVLLGFTIQNAKAGDSVIIDDVQLWESADGSCRER